MVIFHSFLYVHQRVFLFGGITSISSVFTRSRGGKVCVDSGIDEPMRMDRDVSVFWRPLSNELGVCYIIRGWQWSTGPLVGWLMLACQVGDTIASAGWRDGDWVWRFLRHPNYDSMAAMACLYINLWIADLATPASQESTFQLIPTCALPTELTQ